jgi:hypothetical protein
VSVSTTVCGGCSCAFHNPVPDILPVSARVAPKAKVLWPTPRLKLGVGIDYPKTPNNRSVAAGECCGRKRALWFSGYRGRFRYGSDFRYRFGSRHLHRQRDRSGIGSDDKFSLSTHGSLAEALVERAVSRYRQIDNSSDVVRHCVRLSQPGTRNFWTHPSGTVLRKKVHIVATGGYAQLIARELPEIDAVNPHLTLEGLRIVANLNCTHFSEVG